MHQSRRRQAEGTLPSGAAARVIPADMLTPRDRAELARLLRAAFPDGWPAFAVGGSLEEHLDWKLDGPDGEPSSLVTLIELDNQIVSMAVAMRQRVLVRGEERIFEGGGDACTDPRYQGRGLFSERRDFEATNIEVWLDGEISHSQNPIVLDRRRRHGEAAPAALEPRVYVRVLSPLKLARELASRRTTIMSPLVATGTAAIWLYGWARAAHRSQQQQWTAIEVDHFDERFDELFAAASGEFDLIKVRSAAYLNWRYRDPRGGKYQVLAAEKDSIVLGYVVMCIRAGRGYLMDLLIRPNHHAVGSALLNQALNWFRRHGASAVVCWLRRADPSQPSLIRHGFVDVRRRTGVTVRDYAGERSGPSKLATDPHARVRLMLGDTDRA